MRESKPRNIWHLFISIIGTSTLGWYINTIEPASLLQIGGFSLIFFVTSSFLLLYLFNNVRRSLLASIGLLLILALRAIGLREPIYLLLLFALLLSIEYYFAKIRR